MSKTAHAQKVETLDRVLLSLDEGVFGALYRVAIGFALLPALSLLMGSDDTGWAIIPFLLTVLLLLRVGSAIARKLLPFSNTVKQMWAERRRAAKRFDSYQWRKLTWIGVGLALFMTATGRSNAPELAICLICLVGGAAGIASWRTVPAESKPPA